MATIDIGRKLGAVGRAPFKGELGLHLTQRRWDEAYLRTKCHLEPPSLLTTTDMGRKLGALPPIQEGDPGPHLTQCRMGSGLPPYQVASGSIHSFGHNIYGPKIGGFATLGRGSLVPI